MERQADRENLSAMQDAAITQLAESPEHYARYLEVQGDNPLYSAGNVILAMTQNPEIIPIRYQGKVEAARAQCVRCRAP